MLIIPVIIEVAYRVPVFECHKKLLIKIQEKKTGPVRLPGADVADSLVSAH